MADRVLTQSGRKLADIYDVGGARVGIEQLHGREVQLVHDMGAEIASERLQFETLHGQASAVAQSSAFTVAYNVPLDAFQILGVTVLCSSGEETKFADLTVYVLDDDSVYIPIWTWESTTGLQVPTTSIKITPTGGSAARVLFVPVWDTRPYDLTGPRSAALPRANGCRSIQFTGNTNAFGAGTAAVVCNVSVLHTSEINTTPRRLKSEGLPPPW